jgi:hypothetical protein
MKSKKLGKSTSEAEVTNVSKHGFWMLINGKEYFLAFRGCYALLPKKVKHFRQIARLPLGEELLTSTRNAGMPVFPFFFPCYRPFLVDFFRLKFITRSRYNSIYPYDQYSFFNSHLPSLVIFS